MSSVEFSSLTDFNDESRIDSTKHSKQKNNEVKILKGLLLSTKADFRAIKAVTIDNKTNPRKNTKS